MSKWIEYQPVIDELKHEWCNKCNKTCPYNNCKIYRVMQILRRQKPIPHEAERLQGKWIIESELRCLYYCSNCRNYGYRHQPFCGWCGADMRGDKK